MKIIIAGSRSITDLIHVEKAMNLSNARTKATEIVSGGAKGVDTLAIAWAKKYNVPVKVMKAKWDDLDAPGAVICVHPNPQIDGFYNKAAGIQRNHEMGDYSDALVAIWDGVSPGTKDMINYMKKLKKKVYVYTVK